MTVIAVFETVVVFYMKRWVAMGYQTRTMILTSHTVNVVNALFLLSLVAIFAFYGIMISNFAPSQHCSPFRGLSSYSDLFQDMTAALGVVQKYIIMTLRSITATVIIIVVFSLILHYYQCAGNSKSVKIKLLEERIMWEQKDKAFLLAKMSNRSPPRKQQDLIQSESERNSSSFSS
jgi:ABC-type sugar transport system permease subunit